MALWNRQIAVASGLNGLSQGRFVGVSLFGPPTSGTFAVGDYVLTRNGNVYACAVAGTPGTWVTPTDLRNLLSVGEETVTRDGQIATVATTSQVARLTFFTARSSETTTQVRILSGSTAAGATPTLVRAKLYLVDAAGDGTEVAAIPNDPSLFAAASTAYTRSWTTPYAKVAGLRYALGVLIDTAAAAPTLIGTSNGGGGLAESLLEPKLAARIAAAQTDLPSSFVGSSLTSSPSRIYAAILP